VALHPTWNPTIGRQAVLTLTVAPVLTLIMPLLAPAAQADTAMLCCAVQTFDHAAWANHRSTSRYWRHISSMTRSRVVKALAVPMVSRGADAVMVCCAANMR
jgi:hypothetical protein